MSIIWDKDWKYKIALDRTIYGDVVNFAGKIKDKTARQTFKAEIEFFKKNFSLQQVIDKVAILQNDKEYAVFSHNIKKNLQYMLHIPLELKSYYEAKIEVSNPSYKELLTFLLEYGLKTKYFPPMKSYYKLVLGKFYNKVMAKIKSYASQYKKSTPTKYLEEYEVRNSLDELRKKIASNPSTLNLWGDNHKIDYVLKYDNSFGFGKFRSEITSGLNNVLTINCPNHKIEENDLHNQYLTNVYPGYANFVITQFGDTTSRHIDFGANFVINGWSTFSAWHIFPSIYTKNLKIINSKIVLELIKSHSNKNYALLNNMLINSFGKETALKILFQITQMPAKFESRILGAIATEFVIDCNFALNPKNYLERLKRVDITNYFTSLNKLK